MYEYDFAASMEKVESLEKQYDKLEAKVKRLRAAVKDIQREMRWLCMEKEDLLIDAMKRGFIPKDENLYSDRVFANDPDPSTETRPYTGQERWLPLGQGKQIGF